MLRFLLAMYYPFVAGVILLLLGTIAGLAYLGQSFCCGYIFLIIFLLISVVTLLHVLYACRVLFKPIKDVKDPLEIKLPPNRHTIVYDWVSEIAEELQLIRPDEIRLGASTLAHVYESAKGKNVLVLGGMAVGTFTKQALGGIVSHEMAHFTHGDTALSRSAIRRVVLMGELEAAFFSSPLGAINPLAWIVAGYHYLFRVSYGSYSRECEYAADEWEVDHAGKDVAAATLIHLHVTQRMPWVRLTSVVESAIATGQPVPKDVFAEQARRAKSASKVEWERMMKKELSEKTKPTDSHPCLKDRLAAIGVSPKKALEFALAVEGEPATTLFPAWESIQADLAERLTYVAFQRQRNIQEIGQILRGGL